MDIRSRMTLNLAAATYRYEGAREADALERLGYTPTRFRQVVGALIDDPRVMAEEAMVVRRLIRLREMRRTVRAAAGPPPTAPQPRAERVAWFGT